MPTKPWLLLASFLYYRKGLKQFIVAAFVENGIRIQRLNPGKSHNIFLPVATTTGSDSLAPRLDDRVSKGVDDDDDEEEAKEEEPEAIG